MTTKFGVTTCCHRKQKILISVSYSGAYTGHFQQSHINFGRMDFGLPNSIICKAKKYYIMNCLLLGNRKALKQKVP